ncbi:MAG: hypothetical protein A4S09_01985 [Proteobacteria bacterium SG_bin7]|nr:MAG: hypothetical protein A4S09_01985 [Proteobacteria bacterium SG_bin7]
MGLDKNNYNRGGFLAFMSCMAASTVFFIYISFIHPGINIDKPKIKTEIGMQVAQAAGGAAADMSTNPTPWTSTPEFVEYGKTKYKMNCAVCHGDGGKGDGPAGASLNPKPRDLVEGKWKKSGSAKDIFTTIRDGLPGTMMAPFKHIPVVDRWAMTHYVRSISKNAKPEDKPADLEKFAKGEK